MTGHDPDDAEAGIGEIEQYLSRSPVLERVIEVNKTVAAKSGGRLVIVSVELWTTLITFHSAIIGSDAGRRFPQDESGVAERQRRFEYARCLRDDLGNIYDLAGGGGGGGGDPAMQFEQHNATFRGPVCPDASTLLFRPENSAVRDRNQDPIAGWSTSRCSRALLH